VTSILGDGVAANCCAHLLNAAGLGVTMEKTNRPKVPALLIGNPTQALIEDVFERQDVFRGAQRISKRIVAWGTNADPVEIPHSAVVISESELTDRLRSVLREELHRDSGWIIRTSRDRTNELGFGSRIAHAVPARLKESCAQEACWIESLACGWLFLLPTSSGAWLLSVGGPADELLSDSRIVGAQIESLGAPAGQFPAYPRISDPLCGMNWLACGVAAMAFDPICGDGVGNAIREAILASAVVKASASNRDIEPLLAHYRARLLAGFLKHLELCRQFYAPGSGEWWRAELARLDEGVRWCREALGSEMKFRYRLRGFELEPISSEHTLS
jgi:hypothetical protein